jgi:hypothetical protein
VTCEREWKQVRILCSSTRTTSMVAIGREVAGGYSCSLGQPRRKSLQDSEGQAHRHILHLTERTLQRQFGAKSAAAWVQECLGTSRRSRCVAQCGLAARFKTEGGLAKNIGRDGLNHGIGPFVLDADCGRALANRVVGLDVTTGQQLLAHGAHHWLEHLADSHYRDTGRCADA